MGFAIVLFVLGLGMLVFGAELLVRGASSVATMLGISPMVIGLTVVSLGTSAPELAVGIVAAGQDQGALAVGNIAGTNVLNLLFILGLSAAIKTLPLHLQVFKLELPVIVIAALLMLGLAWDGVLSALDGAVMLLFGIAYSVALVMVTRRESLATQKAFREEFGPDSIPQTRPNWVIRLQYVLMLIVGLAITVGGADCLVSGAVEIAKWWGMSETVIGLTIVAIGTSAPELVTTIVSTIKGERDVAVGNLLGSSIYNILLILSVTCMVAPKGLPVDQQLLTVDIPLMAAVAIGAIPIFLTGKRITRWEGALGVMIYLTYLSWLIASNV